MTPRLPTCAVLIAACVMVGCQPAAPKADPTTRNSQLAGQPSATSPGKDPNDSAAALQRKAEEYAKQLEAMVARRANATSRPVATTRFTATNADALNSAKMSTPPLPGTEQSTAEPPVVPQAKQDEKVVISDPPATVPAPQPTNRIEIRPPAHPTTLPIAPVAKHADPLPDRITRAAKEAPRDPAANLDLQLVKFLTDQPTPDMATLSSLASEDREVLSAILDGLSNYRAVVRAEPNALLSRKVRPLLDMADRLRAQANLRIPVVALCTAVKGYGVYDPITAPFNSGRENRALVYCEVAGFASRIGTDQMWETKLSEEVTLYRGDVEVWRKAKADPIPDRCRNRRNDFYAFNLIQLPATLPAGTYTLKVTMIDQIAGRVAESTVPLTIVNGSVADTK